MAIQTYQNPTKPTEYELIHVPVIQPQTKLKLGEPIEVKVAVGKKPHPMTPEHYIEWIELWVGDKILEKKVIMPDQETPEASFTVTLEPGDKRLQAVASCNLHGLWEFILNI